MQKHETEFDPLAVENIGVTLAVELLERDLALMPPPDAFVGAGIYALYYQGPNKAYTQLKSMDAGRNKYPVYIGKAAGENTKQGFNPTSGSSKKLYDRISNHAKSIDEVSNLDLKDFKCRYLVLHDHYISLAESVMIRLFRPPWNGMGFGSKVVGKFRTGGKVSLWDSLHPGRGGRPAGSQRAPEAIKSISDKVADLGQGHTDEVLSRMFDRVMKLV